MNKNILLTLAFALLARFSLIAQYYYLETELDNSDIPFQIDKLVWRMNDQNNILLFTVKDTVGIIQYVEVDRDFHLVSTGSLEILKNSKCVKRIVENIETGERTESTFILFQTKPVGERRYYGQNGRLRKRKRY